MTQLSLCNNPTIIDIAAPHTKCFLYVQDFSPLNISEISNSKIISAILSLNQFPKHYDQHYGSDNLHLLILTTHPSESLKNIILDRPNVGCYLLSSSRIETADSKYPLLGFIPHNDSCAQRQAIAIGFELLKKQSILYFQTLQLADKADKIHKINAIGAMLSHEREVSKLCEKILSCARELTNAEAGSLFLIEEIDGQKHLVFNNAQNDRVSYPFQSLRFPVNRKSIAGYVADSGRALNIADVYKLPDTNTFNFNDNVDRQSGYRTVSMLTIPLKTIYGEPLGVIQLINKKLSPHTEETKAFDGEDEALLESLSAQAASAVLNAKFNDDIQNLLDGFIRASVNAIDSRDPSTKGHSIRVASLTVALAKVLRDETEGPYARREFTPEQLTELQYASLLHDFGKIGIPEQVLFKAKKLPPDTLESILQRFETIRNLEKFDLLRNSEIPTDIEQRLEEIDKRFQAYAEVILRTNEPSILAEGDSAQIRSIQKITSPDGHPLLKSEEAECLSVRKGSLNERERAEIEQHVVHSFNFLRCIPWIRHLRRIPEIVIGHHERPNGTGYPYRKKAEAIPIESRIMAIADVYDALTAQDRPYKKAVPRQRALEIMTKDAEADALDPELLRIFIKRCIFEKV